MNPPPFSLDFILWYNEQIGGSIRQTSKNKALI